MATEGLWKLTTEFTAIFKQLQKPIGVKVDITISQWELEFKADNVPDARENVSAKSRFVLVLHLKGGVSFLDQSRREVKQ